MSLSIFNKLFISHLFGAKGNLINRLSRIRTNYRFYGFLARIELTSEFGGTGIGILPSWTQNWTQNSTDQGIKVLSNNIS
jgi:hypothetical protein